MRKVSTYVLPFVLCLASCSMAETPQPTGPPEGATAVKPTDAGPVPAVTQSVTTEFCSVKVIWNFTDQLVTFKNFADQTAWVTVIRLSDETQLADKVVYSQSEGSKEASFAIGEEVRVIVEFLSPNLSLEQWPECGRREYALGV